MSPREYLLDRFRTDATVLRQRAATLRKGPPQPGPDAATSERMADACEEVTVMIEAIPEMDDVAQTLSALTALIPLLEKRAATASAPAVRAVYVGGATRIREVSAAESKHLAGDGDHADIAFNDADEDDDE